MENGIEKEGVVTLISLTEIYVMFYLTSEMGMKLSSCL